MDYKKLYWKMIAHYKKTRTVPKSMKAEDLTTYDTIHHAWPRCIRPDLVNSFDNLVALSYREHVVIHLVFGKAYGEEHPHVMQSSAYILAHHKFYLSPVSTRMAEEQRRVSSRRLLVEDEDRMEMLMLGGQIYRELNPMSAEEKKRRADKAWATRVKKYGPTGMKPSTREKIAERLVKEVAVKTKEEKAKIFAERSKQIWKTRREKYGPTGTKPKDK